MLAEAGVTCTQCGRGELSEAVVSSALWEGERLIVVEGIRALVCSACSERFFDDDTAVRLDLLRGTGFPDAMARGELRVPVFSLDPEADAEP